MLASTGQRIACLIWLAGALLALTGWLSVLAGSGCGCPCNGTKQSRDLTGIAGMWTRVLNNRCPGAGLAPAAELPIGAADEAARLEPLGTPDLLVSS